MSSSLKSVAIIGAGPAGLAAALQLKRYGITVSIFSPEPNISILRNAGNIENYLGFSLGIPGTKLLTRFYAQIFKENIKIIPEKIELLEYQNKTNQFRLKTSRSFYHFKTVIIASGTKPNVLPQIANQSTLVNKKIFYEIFPIRHKRNKTIIIIGGSDAAFDYALNLHPTNKIIVAHRSPQPSALPLLVQRAQEASNITVISSCALQYVHTTQKSKLSCIFQQKPHNTLNLLADYLGVAIGRQPQKDFYAEELLVQEPKLIKKDILYLIGDVKNSIYRQTAIAVGDGIRAAMKIALENNFE